MLLAETALLRLAGIGRVPMLFALRPRVLRLDDTTCELLVPLGYFSRNHVGSMYIGALAAGADCTGGMSAARTIFGLGDGLRGMLGARRLAVVPLFKTLRAEFLARADGDVLFRCDQVKAIGTAVLEAERTGARVTLPIEVIATVPTLNGTTPVARFELDLSLKRSAR